MSAGSTSLVFLLTAMVAVMRVTERSWFGAATFFGLYWTCLLGAVLVLVPNFTLTVSGVAWIVLSYFALIVGSIAARFGGVKDIGRGDVALHDERAEANTLGLLVAGGALLALCSVPILVSQAGVSVFDLTNFKSLLQVAAYYTSNRYNDPTFREPALGIALWSFAYLASVLGGRLFVVARGVSARGLAFAPIVVAALLAMLMTTRALVLLSLLLWVSGYMVSTVERGRQNRRVLRARTVFLVVVLCCAAVTLFVAGELVRGGGADKVSRQGIYASVATSFLGSTSSFTMWFDQTAGGQLDGYGYGARSLSGELDWLLPGFQRADVGTFTPIVVGNGSGLGEDTTVATLFREWIYDFSPAGCLVLFALLGFFGGRAYAACSGSGIIRGAGLATYYLIVLYSMMGFVYKFTTLLAISIAFGLYCRYLGWRRSGRTVVVRCELAVLPNILSGRRG
jgi:oligosaccharide repeat unit polymerase